MHSVMNICTIYKLCIVSTINTKTWQEDKQCLADDINCYTLVLPRNASLGAVKNYIEKYFYRTC